MNCTIVIAGTRIVAVCTDPNDATALQAFLVAAGVTVPITIVTAVHGVPGDPQATASLYLKLADCPAFDQRSATDIAASLNA